MKFVCDKFVIIEDGEIWELREKVFNIVQDFGVTGILATSNFDVAYLCTLQGELEGLGVRVLCAPKNIIEKLLDKSAYPSLIGMAGLDTPKLYNLADLGSVRFPCVLKPAEGQGTKFTFVVRSMEELQHRVGDVPSPIVQEFVEGVHYTVDVFGNEIGQPICVVPRVRVVIDGSIAVVSRIDMNRTVIDKTSRIGEKLRIVGPYNVQMIKDGERIAIHDVNPRVASGTVLSIAAGAPFPRWICDLLLEGKIMDEKYEIKDGTEMYRYQSQIFSNRVE